MSRIKCLVVEDLPRDQEALIAEINRKSEILAHIGTCNNGLEAFQFLRNNEVDLMFLDIDMPEMTGRALIKILEPINKQVPKVAIVLCSQLADDMVDLNSEHPILSTIRKPVTVEKFDSLMRRTQGYFAHLLIEKPCICVCFIRENKSVTNKLLTENIVWIESQNKLITFHFYDNGQLTALETKSDYHNLTNLLDGRICDKIPIPFRDNCQANSQLPLDQFYRVSSSAIVNRRYIEGTNKTQIYLKGNKSPIGITNLDFENWYNKQPI